MNHSYSDKTFSLLHVTVMNIAVWMLFSCSYMQSWLGSYFWDPGKVEFI